MSDQENRFTEEYLNQHIQQIADRIRQLEAENEKLAAEKEHLRTVAEQWRELYDRVHADVQRLYESLVVSRHLVNIPAPHSGHDQLK
jgi:vacuolar-type H+-ATPase subunit I/STV1